MTAVNIPLHHSDEPYLRSIGARLVQNSGKTNHSISVPPGLNPFSATKVAKVITVEAGPGSGKTRFIDLCVQSTNLPHSWLILPTMEDNANQSPGGFWCNFQQALKELLPNFTLPEQPPSNERPYILALINAIDNTLSGNSTLSLLIIDNVHALLDRAYGETLYWLDLLCELLPGALSICLLSRQHLPLQQRSSRIAGGRLTNISEQQLAFEKSDIERMKTRNEAPVQSAFIEAPSRREREILQLISNGLSNREIAEQLSISISTVKAHIYNVFTKLHSKSRTEAVFTARQLQLIL